MAAIAAEPALAAVMLCLVSFVPDSSSFPTPPGAVLLLDVERTAYAAYGLKIGSHFDVWHPSTMAWYAMHKLKGGAIHEMTEGASVGATQIAYRPHPQRARQTRATFRSWAATFLWDEVRSELRRGNARF